MGIDKTKHSRPASVTRGHSTALQGATKNTAPHLGERSTAKLPGSLPKITKLDVEALGKKSEQHGVKGAHLVAEVPLGMPSSGLVHLASGETLAVSDNIGVCEVRPDKKPRTVFKLKDAEGITVDDKNKFVYVVEEGKRRVRKLEVRRDHDGELTLRDTDETRTLPKLKEQSNTGWEGITFLPKALAGGKRDCLVCVHEGSPRRVGIYELPDLDNGVTLKLPKAAKGLLPDLADVAVDPKTGHLFLVSDQARIIVELAIVRENKAASQGLIENIELAVVSSIDLPLSGKQKPEGLHFDAQGRLWVGLDNENDDKKNGHALVLELER